MNRWKCKLHLIDEYGLNHKLNENRLRLFTQYSRLQIHRISIPLPKNVNRQYSINKVNLIFINQKIPLKASSDLALWASQILQGEKMITPDIRIESSQLLPEGKHDCKDVSLARFGGNND